ncbi:MAG: hypothetical protein AAF787_07820 [Chloroflexota bacterium]
MITAEWHDADRTIIVHRHPEAWGLEDFKAAREESRQMIGSVDHRVDLILLNPGVHITTDMIYHAWESLSIYPEDTGFVVVDDYRVAPLIVNVFRKIHPETRHRVDYVRSIDEAVSSIYQMRRQK